MNEITKEIRRKMGLNMAKTHFENNLIPMLEKCYKEGITEFRLCVRGNLDEANNFYIHPANVSGETIDIDWTNIDTFCEEVDID